MHVFAQAVVLALCLFGVPITGASAGDSGTAAVNLLPAKGQHRGVVLKSQTVDTVISEDEGKVWADTKVWLSLSNPASKPITVSVSLPGPQMAPVSLPADLNVYVNKEKLPLLALDSTNGGPKSGATASIGIPARRSVDVRLAFRQALPESQGVITYVYLLDGAAQWAGTPESLRMTVKFAPPIAMRSLLSITPTAHRSDGETLTWDWETGWAKADVDIGLAFLSPSWFSEFEAARSAATRKDATAAEHISLSRQYRRLASLPALLFDERPRFQSQYYPAAVAELQAALNANASSAEQSQIHAVLAELYLQQADQSELVNRERYLQAAAAEIDSAHSGASPEADLLDDEELLLADHGLDVGSAEKARRLFASPHGFPRGALPDASSPVVSETSLTVSTTPRGRQIVVQLGRGGDLESASDLARRTAEALGSQAGGNVVAAANIVTITLPVPAGREMFEAQQSLAAAVPPVTELALLRSVLEATGTSTDTETSPLRSTWRYTETIDLVPALRQWYAVADELESTEPDLPEGVAVARAERLRQIGRALKYADAAAWRRFADGSTVHYRFALDPHDTDREWQVRAGESREMSVQQSRWNSDGVYVALAAVCTILVAIAALTWRLA